MKTLFIHAICFSIPLLLCNYVSGQGIYNTAGIITTGSTFIIVQDGGFHNNGSFVPATGTFIISGTAATGVSVIGGANPTPFSNLIINKMMNAAQLVGNININGNLTMQEGNLELNFFNIDLGSGSGSIVNETNNARITGTGGGNILKTMNLDAPVSVNPGNIGIAISSMANLGTTVIKRGHMQQTSAGGFSIYRYYDIVPTNNTGLNASLQMYYFGNELAGINKNELNFYRSEDNGVSWSLMGKDNNDGFNNWVLKNSIDKLSRWTLASNINNALPVNLVSFTANLYNRQSQLQWITANEINSSYFDVQRSHDGITFSTIMNVPAKGNSNTERTYRTVDENPLNGKNYYRLKEVDLDGNSFLSPIVSVTLNGVSTYSIFPNPVSNVFWLDINLSSAEQTVIGIYDTKGLLVEQRYVHLNAGNNRLRWDISRLAKGIYLVKSTIRSMPVIKMLKQ